MNHDEFVAKVRERGAYADTDEARRVTLTVLQLLGQRLDAAAAALAARLPEGIGDAVTSREWAWSADIDEFLQMVAHELSGTAETARWDASAVLSTAAEAITSSELKQLLSRLQPAYADLFGTQVA